MTCDCIPLEFKHIDKRLHIHKTEYLQSLRMNLDCITPTINYMQIEFMYIYVTPFQLYV